MRDGGSQYLPDESKLNFENILQVVYTEVDLCHRFIRFTLIDQNKPFKKRLEDYIEEMKRYEDGGLVFTKWQNDEILLDENSNQINKGINTAKSMTLMMISNPGRVNGEFPQFNKESTNGGTMNFANSFKPTSIGNMTLYKESEVKKDPQQQKLSYWFVSFAKQFKSLVEKMKFFELRPSTLNPVPAS